MTADRKILIVAYPGQGHLNPALRFADRLVKMGVDVTFCTSLSAIRRIEKKNTPYGLTFAPFSDGHDNGQQPTPNHQVLVSSFSKYGASAVAEIITSAEAAGRPFKHLVYTTVLPWAAWVAHAHRIKSTLLWCQSATILCIYYYHFNGYQNMKSVENNDPTYWINLPGLPHITTADLPSFLFPSSPKEDDFVLPILKDHINVLKKSPRVLVNTFNELEIDSINAIKRLDLLPIGPLIPSGFADGKEYSSNSSHDRDFFEKPSDDYIEWLNTKLKSSVVYVSFGSISTLSMHQLEEVASGLLEIDQPFLWVIRDSNQARRLRKFEELKKQGMIVSWCCQVEVLSHQAIGCFVTHCGWNSTVESLAAGVPTVVFPQWSDQETNRKMIEGVWRTGIRVRRRESDGLVEGKEIEKCVKMVMEDKEMKKNAEKWSEFAREALNNGGSSTINLHRFLNDVV